MTLRKIQNVNDYHAMKIIRFLHQHIDSMTMLKEERTLSSSLTLNLNHFFRDRFISSCAYILPINR